MREIATRGYLTATRHRVVSPPAGVDRYSVPFFLGPASKRSSNRSRCPPTSPPVPAADVLAERGRR